MRIVIVGGGTAGWMTAAYLQTVFSDLHEITLIESSDIPTIGVGEATFSTLKLFFDRLGLPESVWMPPCNGTYKLAVRFVNWAERPGYFYHPFQRFDVVDGFNMGEWWMKLLRNEMQFDTACFTITELCENNRSPRFFDGTVFDDKVTEFFGEGRPPNTEIAQHTVQYPYGYHFDASLLAKFLKTLAMKRGVRQITDDVNEVALREDGSIARLVTKDHGHIDGDLYVDCTGFRGLLINQALNEPFIDFSDSLPNDRAVAIQIPNDPANEGMPPYTTTTALSAGWTWKIPLYNRNGCGYVFSTRYIDKDAAETELRQFLGPKSDNSRAHHVHMRVGRCRNSWVKNCIAVGLSSAFVEPLESTGLFFIQYAVEEIVNHLPIEPEACENERLSYNRAINDSIDGIREFLILHYCASDRADTPYWRDTKTFKLPGTLDERMKIWKARLPAPRNIFQPFHGFEAYSYACILLGMNCQPAAYHPVLDVRDEAKARAMFRAIRERSARLVQTLPSQYEYLKYMRNGASNSVSAAASHPRELAREHSVA